MNGEDPFRFALEAGQVSKSQEELLARQPLVGETLPSSDGEDQSPVAEERYGPSSPLLMVSLPDSQDDLIAENTHQDQFHTPPEGSADRTVQADTEMADVGDSCGGYSEGRPLVDLSRGSDLGVSKMEVVIERTVTTETCPVGFSEMLLENELQLKVGLRDLTDQKLKFLKEIPKCSVTGNVNAVANSKGKEVACAGNASPSLPTVRDGDKHLLKNINYDEDENVCGGSSRNKEALFVQKGPPGVRQKVRKRSEDEELNDFEVGKRAEAEGILETAENIERDAMEAEDHQILRMLPMSLKTIPDNEPSGKGLDSEMKGSQKRVETCKLNRNNKVNESEMSLKAIPENEPSRKGLVSEMKGSQQRVETGKLNRNSKINESAEEVSKENSVKWVENAVGSNNQELGSLPMPLLEWIENTRKNLNSKMEGSVGREGETSRLLDLLKRVKANTDYQDADEDADDLEGLGLLHILKSRGVTYPRPKWWSDELYKKSKLKEFIN